TTGCRPRPRGDRPSAMERLLLLAESSPPARGSSVLLIYPDARVEVVPARAGIVRSCGRSRSRNTGRPRPRGDRPAGLVMTGFNYASSPPARECRLPRVWALGQVA
ncbi:hypothetical protein, partial [Actinokineospora sp.]|uniref:hypothetical protein n=1 Tax=Actinokineospora sp. TaxID=1872133 RepID=UPI003D6AE13B